MTPRQPIKLDPINRRKIVLAKQLYQRAVTKSELSHSAADKIMAVIMFDWAIETVLKAIIRSLDSKHDFSKDFKGLIEQADNILKSCSAQVNVPNQSEILNVRSIRNDAQHEAKIPDETIVSDCRTYTKDFLQKIVSDVWGLSFEKIHLADLICDPDVKQYIMQSEIDISLRKYDEAVKNAASGLTKKLSHIDTENLVGPEPDRTTKAFITPDRTGVRSKNLKIDYELYDTFKQMRETLLYVVLGINYADYMRFKQIVGYIRYDYTEKQFIFPNIKDKIEYNDAEFVVAYCIESILQIESIFR